MHKSNKLGQNAASIRRTFLPATLVRFYNVAFLWVTFCFSPPNHPDHSDHPDQLCLGTPTKKSQCHKSSPMWWKAGCFANFFALVSQNSHSHSWPPIFPQELSFSTLKNIPEKSHSRSRISVNILSQKHTMEDHLTGKFFLWLIRTSLTIYTKSSRDIGAITWCLTPFWWDHLRIQMSLIIM